MSYCKKLGIKLPNFDREKMLKVTADSPIWVHFGAGNIFRAFIATIQQELLEKGLTNKGIIAAFTVEPKIIDNVWMPHDNISLRVTVSNDGTMEKLIVASISECLFADKSSNDWTRLIEIFKSQSLQIVSFTITEKGYDPKGETMKKIRELLNERKKVGAPPIALVSMDNCINNGDILKKGIGDSNCYDGMSFPLTMIDKITPHPNEEIKKKLETMGVEGLDIIVTEIGTHSSGFVNTEKTQYLVIEDNFPNGRPPLENVGVIFADRKTVNLVEKMKVGACLNPLHFCVAIFGTLLRFNTMADAVCDMDIKRIIEYMGFEEELPIVTDPIIINPRDFLEECINVRFPNTFLPDDPARITTDASAKITTRFEDTIKEYIEKYPTKLENLRMIPLLFAGWIRYLMAIDDDGNSFKLSPDPLLEELIKHVKNIRLGQQFDAHRHVKPILCNRKLFKINVYETPLGKAIEDWFMKLTESRGAVRRTIRLIKKYDSISLD